MSWIESHDTLARHPKTKRLARALGANLPQTIGHLHLLWWWSLEYAQDGNLTGFEPEELADAALWEGDAPRFVDAMKQAGFLDVTDGAVLIHDWEDYAGKLLQRREANRAKQEAYRNRHKPQEPPPQGGNSRDMLPSHIPDITVTSPSRNGATVPYHTVPDQTIPNQVNTIPTLADEGACAPEIVDNFTPWAKACWDAYPARNGKKLHKAEFVRALKAAPVSQQDRIMGAIVNYAASSQAVRGYAEDPHRFMRHWQDWEQPETTTQKGPRHDHHTYSDPDAIAAEIARLTADQDVPGNGAEPVPFRRRA